jgi:magnesium-transporting ATPase (P-type)
LKLLIEIIFLNWIVILAGAVSLAFYWLFVIVFNTHAIASVFQPQIDNVYFRMFSNLQFWFALFFLPLIALIPDATMKYFQMLYKPTISDEAIISRKILNDKRISTDSDIPDLNRSNKSTHKPTSKIANKNGKTEQKKSSKRILGKYVPKRLTNFVDDSLNDHSEMQPMNHDLVGI